MIICHIVTLTTLTTLFIYFIIIIIIIIKAIIIIIIIILLLLLLLFFVILLVTPNLLHFLEWTLNELESIQELSQASVVTRERQDLQKIVDEV